MKKIIALLAVFCLLLVGCSEAQEETTVAPTEEVTEVTEVTEAEETTEAEEAVEAKMILPLPDTTMENLDDAILAVALEEGGAYVDDEGAMQMDLTIYTYDKYDMVDISMLQVGDIIVGCDGELEVATLETGDGFITINGGLEEGGMYLATDDSGVYYEVGMNDAKNWYEVGAATIRVSDEFVMTDSSDLEAEPVVYYPGDFLNGTIEGFYFTPLNTTVRVEGGKIVELNLIYVP